MKFETTKRQIPFKNRYNYKFYMSFKVTWDQYTQTETWKAYLDKKTADQINDFLDYHKSSYVRQGQVYYIDCLDSAFKLRLMFDEYINKIETWSVE